MSPHPVLLWMDSGPGSPSSSMLARPLSLWRLSERRSRKAGSGNIFSNVNVWQLQRLFKAAGDQDAEQRAQLVWCHRNGSELAQALIALKARSHRSGTRANARDALGTHWLRAFNHLRIGENSVGSQVKDPEEESDSEVGAQSLPETSGIGTGTSVTLSESQGPVRISERPVKTTSGLKRGGDNNPERYLHRILH
ncbi:arginine vasopressin-induced protein 1 [Pholidichthys leucotaenia]